jgi:hypothetical protein
MRRFVFLAVVALVMAVVLVSPTQAATPLTVINTNDSGAGSLRQAILDANGAAGEDTINFQPSLSPATITLVGSQLPPITDSAGLIIDGGSAKITLSGNNTVRVFEVGTSTISGAKLTLNNLTVANGRANNGGGILNNSSNTLVVNNSTISGNITNAAGGLTGTGGGIHNSGALTVSNSTISDNNASVAGGIDNYGTLTVSNSTVSGNKANFVGGIYNNAGTLTVSNSTISNNTGHLDGVGIYDTTRSTTTLKNTIVANTLIGSDNLPSGEDCSGIMTDGGYNLDSGTSCGFTTENNSLSSTDPMLGSLADNGGPTKTHALLEGSPAIDKGVAVAGITTDQRGVARPQGAAPDIGSFELEKPDTIRPSGTVLINNGAARTNSTAVTLKLSATDPAPGSGVAQMRFSNNGSTWSGWEAYATTKGWTLGSANGTKTVYAQFKDGAGNVSVAAQDAIVLDTIKPRVSTATPTGTGIGRGTNVAATFSEKMSPTSITSSTFKLYRVTSSGTTQVTNVTVTLSSDGLKATLNPFGSSTTRLAASTQFRVVVTTGAKDLAGNALDQSSTTAGNQQKTWTFTTQG